MTREEKIQGFVLGSLSALEREAVERDRLVDAELDLSITQLEQAMAPLAEIIGELVPSDDLFGRIERAVMQEKSEYAGKTIIPLNEGEWHSCFPGVDVKWLWSDKVVLLRCKPGAVLPPHQHPQREHMLVVTGDIVIGGRSLRTGDYHVASAGNDHDESYTVGGCILFVQYAA